jgi:hypothetical protein
MWSSLSWRFPPKDSKEFYVAFSKVFENFYEFYNLYYFLVFINVGKKKKSGQRVGCRPRCQCTADHWAAWEGKWKKSGQRAGSRPPCQCTADRWLALPCGPERVSLLARPMATADQDGPANQRSMGASLSGSPCLGRRDGAAAGVQPGDEARPCRRVEHRRGTRTSPDKPWRVRAHPRCGATWRWWRGGGVMAFNDNELLRQPASMSCSLVGSRGRWMATQIGKKPSRGGAHQSGGRRRRFSQDWVRGGGSDRWGADKWRRGMEG